MMHFQSTLFQIFPQFPRNFSDSVENFHKFYLFRKEISIFIRRKFLMTLFSHQPQIFNFPLFSPFQSISPSFEKNHFPATFANFSPSFVKFSCFLHTFCDFRFPPYFDHDAFMHHTMHVLDASDLTQERCVESEGLSRSNIDSARLQRSSCCLGGFYRGRKSLECEEFE